MSSITLSLPSSAALLVNSHSGKSLETERAVSARAFVDKVEKYEDEEKNKVDGGDPFFRNGSLTKAFFRSVSPKEMPSKTAR